VTRASVGRPLRIQALGRVRIWIGDREIAAGPPRRQALLAILASSANIVVSHGQLIEGMWGEHAPATAEGSLHTYVSGLRSALEPDRTRRQGGRLQTTSDGYLLELSPMELDVHDFDAALLQARSLRNEPNKALAVLDTAAAQWHGEPWSGVPGPFAEAERNRLGEVRLTIVEKRFELHLELGHERDVTVELAEAVRQHPLRERLRELLMLSLYRSGRRAEALEVYQAGWHLLIDELGIEPRRELQQLHQQILAEDEAIREDTPATDPRPDRVAVPAQLPHDVAGFTGRRRELAELEQTRRAESGTLIVSAIDGPGGVGKTALAIRFGHQIAHDFPDGQLYLNLRGFDSHGPPLAPDEALRRLLNSLGVALEKVPEDTDDASALYRSLLAEKKMLLLLDNAVSTSQVRPLLPGRSRCLVLVTSRNRLAGLVSRDGAHTVPIDVLAPTEATLLLERIIGTDRTGAEPLATSELARLCGHLPLALRVAAERAAMYPARSLAELAHELSGEHDRLDVLATADDEQATVRAVFSWSYHALKPELASAFRLLGLHVGPDFDVRAAAALIGQSVEEVRPLLHALAAGHLLEPGARDRFHFHDLLRLYALERALDEEPEHAMATRRELAWYAHAANAGRYHFLGGAALALELPHLPPTVEPMSFRNQGDAAEWGERELANVIAATRHAFASGHYDLAWQLPVAMHGFFLYRQHRVEEIQIHLLGLSAAERCGDARGQVRVFIGLVGVLIDSGRYGEAIEYGQRAVELCHELGDRFLEAPTVGNLGDAFRRVKRLPEALHYMHQALAAARETGNNHAQGVALSNICQILGDLGRLREALDFGRQAEEVWREVGDRRNEAISIRVLGDTYRKSGDPGRALELLEDALERFKEIGDRLGEALTLHRIATALDASARTEQAQSYARLALEIFEEIESPEADETRDWLDRHGA